VTKWCATCSTTATRAPNQGAIVCRVAPSFIRFGNFELPASRDDSTLLRQLVDFTIARDFPELGDRHGAPGSEQRYAAGSAKSASAPRAWSPAGCASASSMA
jgi:uncharacterized protein YdiU (UPF0061 family)